jgi:hypothetical protein
MWFVVLLTIIVKNQCGEYNPQPENPLSFSENRSTSLRALTGYKKYATFLSRRRSGDPRGIRLFF